MSNKDTLINQIKSLQYELHSQDHEDDPMPIWVELGKCYLLAYELLNKKEYEELVQAVFWRKMQFTSMAYCQDIINNFVHHYLESVEKRIKKRDDFIVQPPRHAFCATAFTAKEAEFSEAMKQYAEEIARVYNVPPQLLGDIK